MYVAVYIWIAIFDWINQGKTANNIFEGIVQYGILMAIFAAMIPAIGWVLMLANKSNKRK